jgi:hypothetical protein
MNIYDYFLSSDIAEHCQKIKHIFSPLDMAVIICISEKTLEEKHSAWREIIAEYPDMPIHASINFRAKESLHVYLREFIAREESQVRAFAEPLPGTVFRFRTYEKGIDSRCESGSFSSIANALKAIYELYDDDQSKASIDRIYIDKETIDDGEKTVSVKFNFAGKPLDIYTYNTDKNDLDTLDMIFIDVPVPFKKGDLIMGANYVGVSNGQPAVLYNLPHWWKIGNLKYGDFVSGKRGDGFDMLGHIYTIDGGRLTLDHGGCYLRYKFFKTELKGQDRFLKYLSQYIKNKDNSFDWLIAVFQKFKAEAECEKENSFFGGWFRELE